MKSLITHPLQAYLNNSTQLFDVIEDILNNTGKADIFVSTFSISEEFLRRLYRLKKKGYINKSVLLADAKASRKTVNLYTFIKNVFDDVYLSENHSKVILVHNDKWNVSVVTSQNQTRGNRFECGIITTNNDIFNLMMSSYNDIISLKSIHINELFG